MKKKGKPLKASLFYINFCRLVVINNIQSGSILKITEKYLEEFYALISKIDDTFYNHVNKEFVLKQVENQNLSILESINHFLEGEIIEYYLSIYNTFFNSDLGIKNVYYKKWPSKQKFYRLRTNSPNKKYKNKEMFHIPFEEIRKTGNQRFSLSGHPALYLGSSSFICWEELNNPSLEFCNFSVFSNESELNIFDLTPPEIMEPSQLLRFPLIIASSIKLNNDGYNFKPEYIIPQALYFSILRFNKIDLTKEKKEVNRLDGILYLSTHISNDLLFNDLNLMHNFVFPIARINDLGYCDKLKKQFSVSESRSVNDLWLKYPHFFVSGNEEYSEEYELSIFHTIEKYICGRTVYKSLLE